MLTPLAEWFRYSPLKSVIYTATGIVHSQVLIRYSGQQCLSFTSPKLEIYSCQKNNKSIFVNKYIPQYIIIKCTAYNSKHHSLLKTHTKRRATQHDCLPRLLDDEDKLIEIVYGEEKIFCTIGRLEQPRQNKNLLYLHGKPNAPTKEGPFYLYSLSPHFPQFQQLAGANPLQSPTYCFEPNPLFMCIEPPLAV